MYYFSSSSGVISALPYLLPLLSGPTYSSFPLEFISSVRLLTLLHAFVFLLPFFSLGALHGYLNRDGCYSGTYLAKAVLLDLISPGLERYLFLILSTTYPGSVSELDNNVGYLKLQARQLATTWIDSLVKIDVNDKESYMLHFLAREVAVQSAKKLHLDRKRRERDNHSGRGTGRGAGESSGQNRGGGRGRGTGT